MVKKEKEKKTKKKFGINHIFKGIYWLVVIVLFLIAGAVVLSTFNTPLKFRLFSVQSGSMEPNIHLGSLVIVKPQESYIKGDVVTIKGEREPKKTFTHRIVEVQEDKDLNRINYQTKGDANEGPDPELIPHRRVVGKVIASIPYLGQVVAFAQTQVGLAVLVIIPATIIIYSELVNIKNEIKRMIKDWKAKKSTKKNVKK